MSRLPAISRLLHRALRAWVLLALFPLPTSAAQVGNDEPAASPTAPSARAAALEGEVRIDGRLDESAWDAAPVISGFIQREPSEGVPAEYDTEARILFSQDALYVAARLHDPFPETIADQLVRRGEEGQYDYVELSLDPNLDRRTGYRFRVSAAGVQLDEYLYEDDESDGAWEAVWEAGVVRDSLGWTVEMRIPLSQLRYRPSPEPQSWGLNITRRRLASNEVSDFALQSRTRSGVVSQFGRLEGILLPDPSRRIEVRPYALTSAATVPPLDRSPLRSGTEFGRQVGTDVRYGLGGAFTLDVTLNPDFGQVESDPAEINLGAFETFLREQRPFFVEDARVLDFTLSGRQNQLFYSRRVGRSPTGAPPPGAAAHRTPEASRIIGAAKLTGRTAGGLSVGGLVALTEAVEGRSWHPDENEIRSFRAEPQARYGVGRVQQDFRDGQSQIGAIVTGMFRDLPSDGRFDLLTSSAYSAGMDFDHSWGNRTWGLTGHLALSHVRGDSLALLRIQRSPNHYYQRPDARRHEVDPALTSMTGGEWRVQFDRRSGRHWTGALWAAQGLPGFEVNDLGFSSSAERLNLGGRIQYRDLEPGPLFRDYRFTFFTSHNVSHEVFDLVREGEAWRDAYTFGFFSTSADFTFLNYWSLGLTMRLGPTTMDETATRGGPWIESPGGIFGEVSLESDPRRRVSVAPSVSLRKARRGAGEMMSAAIETSFRPSPRLEFQLEPTWDRILDGAQYVATVAGAPREETFGASHLFGELDRTEVSMVTRMNLTFSPTLTLQLFAQPFLASGEYREYRVLERPRSYDFESLTEGAATSQGCTGGRTCVTQDGTRRFDLAGDGEIDYTTPDRDFNIRSLIGNVVLRWEYRPGSTLYLVWQHVRDERAAFGDFRFRRELDALAGMRGENVLILKANYWLGL